MLIDSKTADPLAALAVGKPIGLIGRVMATSDASYAEMTQQLDLKRLEQLTSQSCRVVTSVKGKILEGKMTIGAVLYVNRKLAQHLGGLSHCVKQANIERTEAYRCLRLFTFFALHCNDKNYSPFLARFSLQAAQDLALPSTPKHIQEHFIAQAKDGKQVTYSEVKRAIEAHKKRLLPNEATTKDAKPWIDRTFQQPGKRVHLVLDQPMSKSELERFIRNIFALANQERELRSNTNPSQPAGVEA